MEKFLRNLQPFLQGAASNCRIRARTWGDEL